MDNFPLIRDNGVQFNGFAIVHLLFEIMEGNLTAVCSSQKLHYHDFVYSIVHREIWTVRNGLTAYYEKCRCIKLLKRPQILLLQVEHLIQITHGFAPSTACAQWASALFRGKGLLFFCEYGTQFNSVCSGDYGKTVTGDAQGGVLSCRAHVCMHVSW